MILVILPANAEECRNTVKVWGDWGDLPARPAMPVLCVVCTDLYCGQLESVRADEPIFRSVPGSGIVPMINIVTTSP